MELGGKGGFQAFKLQRPARTTVCSHSTRDMAATRSIESKHDHNDIQNECLCSCEQSGELHTPPFQMMRVQAAWEHSACGSATTLDNFACMRFR